jgi:hypothetical protein
LLLDRQAGAVEVERAPREPRELSASHPGGRRETPQREQPIIVDVVEEPAELVDQTRRILA